MSVEQIMIAWGEQLSGNQEITEALDRVKLHRQPITSHRRLRHYIIRLAREYGFSIFTCPRFGYAELTVRTRIKHAQRYGNKPTTKFMVISHTFVCNLYRIYKKWPELGEYLLKTALWHEYKHLYQDLAQFQDFQKREDEANRFMIEKMGRPGLVISVWYYSMRRNFRLWEHIIYGKARLDAQARKRIVSCLENIYQSLIPPECYDEIVRYVLWLDEQFTHHKPSG